MMGGSLAIVSPKGATAATSAKGDSDRPVRAGIGDGDATNKRRDLLLTHVLHENNMP